MPAVQLEFTKNISQGWDPKKLLLSMHYDMVSLIKTDLRTCRSTIICHDDFVIGDASDKNAFVFLTIHILPGRDQTLKEKLGQMLVAKLKDVLSPLFNDLDIQYRVYVRETDNSLYFG